MATLERKYVGRWVPKSPTFITILLIGVCVVNSATLGYDASMMNGLNILPQYKDYFHLDAATTGLNNAASWMGSILACLLLQPIPDRFGRKFGILFAALVCIAGTIIQAAAQNTGMFVTGRTIVGLGSGLASGAAPTLIGELMGPARRGAVLGFFFSCFFVGSLLSSGINYRLVDVPTTWAWRIPSLLQCLPSALSIALLPFVPESPRWLCSKGRKDEAREVLAVVHGHGDLKDSAVRALFDEVERVLQKEQEMYPKNPWMELVSTKANQRRLLIIVTFGISIELYGNFVISYYLGDMLTQAGITDPTTQLQVNVILNCWSFIVAICGSLLLDVVGRRIQAMACIVGMIVSLYTFGGLAKVYGTKSDNKSGIYGTLAVLFLFQGFYALSITPLTSLYAMEILPFKIRNTGIAVFRFFDSGFGLLASFAMSYAMTNLGWKFYFINASWNFLFLACVYFLWVETAKVPLEEVAMKFGDLRPEDIVDGIERQDSSDKASETNVVAVKA